MSYKDNIKYAYRKRALAVRADKQRNASPNPMNYVEDKYGRTSFKPRGGYPAYVRAGTPMKHGNRMALDRAAVRLKLGEEVVELCNQGQLSRVEVFGFHPTKSGANIDQNRIA